MTKTESAEKLIKTLVIESCEQLLDFHGAEGVRAAIPNTNNLIMVGPADWIAKNVPGVQPASTVTDGDSARDFVDAWHREHFPTDRTFSRYIMGRDRHCALAGDFAWQLAKALEAMEARLAATTQASTAQAERAPEGWKLVPIKPTDEMARAGYYALPEPAQDVNAEICWDAMLAAAPVTTTSSTDAQAAAEVRK